MSRLSLHLTRTTDAGVRVQMADLRSAHLCSGLVPEGPPCRIGRRLNRAARLREEARLEHFHSYELSTSGATHVP